MSDWKKAAEARKKAEEELEDRFCTEEANKKGHSDEEKIAGYVGCKVKLQAMSPAEREVFLATHPPEAPAPPPSPIPASDTRYQAQRLQCEREGAKAPNDKTRANFLEWCLADVPPEARPAYAPTAILPENTDPKIIAYPLDSPDVTEVGPLYEPWDEEALRFDAAHPISPSDAVITRKFSLLLPPEKEIPEKTRKHLQQVVTAFYNGGSGANRKLVNAYSEVCFAHFQHLVNTMIREGLRLPPIVRINAQQQDAKGKVVKDADGKPVMKEEDYEVFAKATTYAEKKFGDLVIERVKQAVGKSPWLDRLKKLDSTAKFQFHNRVGRCAGAVAYHIVRNYRIQWMITSKLVETLLRPLEVPLKESKAGKAPSLGWLVRALFEEEVRDEEEDSKAAGTSVTIDPLATLFDRQFPLNALVKAGRKALEGQSLPKGYLNFAFVRNSYRYLRNLLRQACQTGPVKRKPEAIKDFRQTLERGLAAAKAGTDLDGALGTWLSQPHVSDTVKTAKAETPQTQTALEFQLDSYLRRLSARLTKRVRFLLRRRKEGAKEAKKEKSTKKGKKRTFGEGVLDPLIQDILTLDHKTFGEIASAKAWQKSRQKWRDQTYAALYRQLTVTDMGALVHEVVQQVNATLEGEFLHRIFDLRPARTAFVSGDFPEFLAFLRARIGAEAEARLVQEFYPTLRPYLLQFLQLLQGIGPAQFPQLQQLPFFKRPCYTGRGIPTAHAKDQDVCVVDQTGGAVTVTLQLEARFLLQFTLATQRRRKNPAQGDRFRPLIEEGWEDRPGTLLKTQGGGLLLALPFSKSLKSQAPVTKQAQMPAREAGLDLGLKDFGTVSVFEGGREIARQFLDQWQLLGQRTAWFLPPDPATAEADRQRFFNWKNRLRFLREEAASYQAQLADYRTAAKKQGLSSKRLHHKRKFQELRRAWQRCWRKLTQLHEELARQLATRVVALCAYYRVAVLRVEDLRWARHKPKAQAGYFLTAMQIHWFHGQIQQRIKDLAKRVGLRVELVKARDTSKACSRCVDGTLGTRDGKHFVHQHCPQNGKKSFQLDADLNAARNIARALPRGLASD